MVNRRRPAVAPLVLAAVLAAVLAVASPALTGQAPERHWPSFRGPNASGVADGFPLPAEWDGLTGRNIRWKTPIPGLGHSSPVVWGNRLFVATAISGVETPELKVGLYGDIGSVNDTSTHRWLVYALDTVTGKILWEKAVHSGVPKIKRHPKSTHANSTMVTDGRHLAVFFGSEGLYCFDLDGKLLWKKDLGLLDSAYYVVPEAQWEFASSPVIFGDRVLVQCDVLNGSFIAALSLADGREIWRTSREDVPTWGTPTVHTEGGRTQMIVNGYKHAGGYDVATGKEIWRLQGGGDIPVPTPVVAHGLVFLTSAHGRLAPIYAIRLSASGDISLGPSETSNASVAWSYPRDGAYMITPVVYGDYLYNAKNNGVLSCYHARTGERMYQARLGGGRSGFTASPVAGDGKIYFASEDGDIYVIKAGPVFEVLATNAMGDVCMASPALSQGAIYLRTKSHVVAVAATK
ncbi:MAG: PQQ-binding-like beta-propeller repeat protein [Acidobacteriota bacterium]